MPSLTGFDLSRFMPVSGDIKLVYPHVVILAFMLGILLLDTLLGEEEETRSTAVIAVLGLVMAGLYCKGATALSALIAAVTPWSVSITDLWSINSNAFGGLIHVDNYSLFFNLIFIGAGILTILASARYIEREDMNHGEYYVVILGAVLGMMLMASAGSLLTVFIGIELLSICLYVLAGMNRNRMSSPEAAIKYLLLGAFSTGFLVYGMALIYGATGTLDIIGIHYTLNPLNGPLVQPSAILIVGMIFMLVGFSFKASLVPFHQWAPDVYQGAPTPITGFMSTAAKAAAFAVFFRVLSYGLPSMHEHWHAMLYVIAIITMTVGNLSAVNQVNIKRMLAYSSIAHAGYLVIAILAAGRGVELGARSIGFYLLAYTFMNIGAFTVLSAMSRKGKDIETLDAFKGLGYRRPMYAAAMALCMLSLAGMPPTAGFVGKFYIFVSAYHAGLLPLVIIGVLNAVISVYYYLRVIVFMYMHDPEGEEAIDRDPVLWWPASLAVIICVAGILAMGMFPSRFIYLVSNAVLVGLNAM